MESVALRKRAAWLHSVAMRLSKREVAEMLDHYAVEMLDEARRLEAFDGVKSWSRLVH
jgi:uncharacterized protein (DUF1810 family)